jgi:tryptophan 2,3-dioxygenase
MVDPPDEAGLRARQTDYSSYLFIDDLLRLQQPLTDGAEDEMLFIVVHQAYELWFKLVLHELEGARDSLLRAEPWHATRRLRRAVAAEELLVGQLRVLETMSPEGFFEFRDPLAPASGFQSVQFREIEILSGGFGASPGAVNAYDAEARERLERRSSEPTLWHATLVALAHHGWLPESDADRTDDLVLGAVGAIYHDHADPIRAWFHELFEHLIDHDEVIARWRYHHMLMASREIGGRPGTGGSLGVAYLGRTLDKRFFPVLWELRSKL